MQQKNIKKKLNALVTLAQVKKVQEMARLLHLLFFSNLQMMISEKLVLKQLGKLLF